MRLIADAALVVNDTAEELVLFDRRDGSYHTLNSIGSAIWRDLATGLLPAAIVERLVRRYGAPRERIALDVDDFLTDALAKGLLVELADPA
jgi:coenzyme PQQ synthesis protein D (PqqD)